MRSASYLVEKYGWSSSWPSANISSVKTPLKRPATAIELTWWKRAAPMALANSTVWWVPSMLARPVSSSEAVRS